jgi:hypothetical protein
LGGRCRLTYGALHRHQRRGIVFTSRNGKSVAEDHLCNKTIGAWSESISGAQLDVKDAELEIRDREQLLALLRTGQKIAELAEVGVIFESEEPVIPEIASKPQRRRGR